jgi:hypothetical protein
VGFPSGCCCVSHGWPPSASCVSPTRPPTTWALLWEEWSTISAVGNVFEQINFEKPVGGVMTVRGQYRYEIDGVCLWGLSAQATNGLVAPRASSAGQSNYYGLIQRVCFASGTATGSGYRSAPASTADGVRRGDHLS